METFRLSNRADKRELERWAAGLAFLALLLNPIGESRVGWAAHASESNLFFSNMYGASADVKFGLKPRNVSLF